ncbi:MAG: hypothetical protein GY858_02755 [Candidatus Omnitrophica bacterium]|nr:hypothetical protein [Candidatus Omnitrophota bacterium]
MLSFKLALAKPIQLFLEKQNQAICGVELNVLAYALNDRGEVDAAFSGKKNVTFSSKADTKPCSFPKNLKFKNGKGIFSIKCRKEIGLNLVVEIEGVNAPTNLSASFVCRDVLAPFVEGIMIEAKNLITVKFSEEVEDESAQGCENYTAITNKREVHPESIEYHKDTVILKFGIEFDDDEEGYVEVDEVKDLSGNAISSGKSPTFKGDCGC